MLPSVRGLLASGTSLAHARLELLGADLREERSRLGVAVIGSLIVLFFAGLGVIFAALALMLLAWDHFRVVAATLLALAFLALAAYGAVALRRLARSQPRMFDASLSALERDRELLARAPAPAANRASSLGRWIALGLAAYSLARRVFAREPARPAA